MQYRVAQFQQSPLTTATIVIFWLKTWLQLWLTHHKCPHTTKCPTMLPIIKLQKRFNQRINNSRIWQCIAMWGSWGLSLSGESEPPDPWECEETRRELTGRHTPPSGHCQGDKHETAETEEGAAFSRVPHLTCFFPGGAHSRSSDEAKDAKTGRSRDFEAVLEQ